MNIKLIFSGGAKVSLKEAFRNRIFELCRENNISINKLSTICGITQSTLNSIINTGSNDPKLSTVKKICDGLEITLAQFFDTPDFNNLEQEIK